jgi:hypothetical protein
MEKKLQANAAWICEGSTACILGGGGDLYNSGIDNGGLNSGSVAVASSQVTAVCYFFYLLLVFNSR